MLCLHSHLHLGLLLWLVEHTIARALLLEVTVHRPAIDELIILLWLRLVWEVIDTCLLLDLLLLRGCL